MDFVIPVCVTVLFLLAKFIEMKLIDRQQKPLKHMVRDGLIVFLVTILVVFFYSNYSYIFSNFFSVVTDNTTLPVVGTPEVFTNVPEF